MDAASPRFFGSHVFPVTDTLIARECLVRLGKHEARALVVAGQPITVWVERHLGKCPDCLAVVAAAAKGIDLAVAAVDAARETQL